MVIHLKSTSLRRDGDVKLPNPEWENWADGKLAYGNIVRKHEHGVLNNGRTVTRKARNNAQAQLNRINFELALRKKRKHQASPVIGKHSLQALYRPRTVRGSFVGRRFRNTMNELMGNPRNRSPGRSPLKNK